MTTMVNNYYYNNNSTQQFANYSTMISSTSPKPQLSNNNYHFNYNMYNETSPSTPNMQQQQLITKASKSTSPQSFKSNTKGIRKQTKTSNTSTSYSIVNNNNTTNNVSPTVPPQQYVFASNNNSNQQDEVRNYAQTFLFRRRGRIQKIPYESMKQNTFEFTLKKQHKISFSTSSQPIDESSISSNESLTSQSERITIKVCEMPTSVPTCEKAPKRTSLPLSVLFN